MDTLKLCSRERAQELLPLPARDRAAFFRLERLLGTGLPMVLTDGKDCLLAQEGARLPLWLWTSGACSDALLHALLLSLSVLYEDGRLTSIVCKNRVGRLLSLAFGDRIARAHRLSVYTCRDAVPFTADGEPVPASAVPPETASALIETLAEADGMRLSPAERREAGAVFCADPNAFAWRAESGEIASIARVCRAGGEWAELHTVVTAPVFRGRGYARSLLYALAKRTQSEGLRPMLYADRANETAAGVYRALGFSETASLTMLRFSEENANPPL